MMKFRKIMIIVLLILLALSALVNFSYAAGPKDFDGTLSNTDAEEPIANLLGGVLGVIRVIGVVIAVVILVVIACKYMLAAPGDRADLKKYLQLYVIGALVFFGAAGLVEMIRTFTNDATGG